MACPCDVVALTRLISNPPGRDTIAYRVGDYLTFRRALLQSLPGEVELVAWRPTAEGDLALQMMEWWAYLADILTFYNERIANQDYLRTADLPESAQRLVRVLGYRPRPGIGAQGTLAALMSGPKPLTLPAGFQIQSKPGPGKQPQIFELSAVTLVQQPDAVAAIPVADPALLSPDGKSVLLAGTVSSIKAGDEVLLLEKGWIGSDKAYATVVVQGLGSEKDPAGNAMTRVTFKSKPDLPQAIGPISLARVTVPDVSAFQPLAKNYRLLRSSQSAHVWPYPLTPDQAGRVELESIARGINVRDPVLFVISGGSPVLASVNSYSEAIGNANVSGQPPIPIPHTTIGLVDSLTSANIALVRYAWQDVGTLIPSPAKVFRAGASLTSIPPAVFSAASGAPLLVEDATGVGESAFGIANSDRTTLQLSRFPSPPPTLASPLNVLFNLLPVTRGKTVSNEVLGSGDATLAAQEFVLKNSPLTYLPSAGSTSGVDYASTLRVWVNGVQWKEVPSFFGQGPAARIFVTREDEQNKTHVQFGDGVYGSRLPSGISNVVATYRYGSGADAPDAGSLTVILQPQPGLKAIRNPVPVGGGADPDPPKKIKKYAPQSVLTFGRAVSADDYETIAAQAPGVARARSYWTWDPIQQRSLVKIYVGDDGSAVTSARTTLAAADDPNRPVQVSQATPLIAVLNLSLAVDPNYVTADVVNAASAALLDPDNGLFGANAIGIGQRIYESQIFQACLSVPGAVAVHNLQFSVLPPAALFPEQFRFDPGEGGFFQLTAANLTISPEVAPNAG